MDELVRILREMQEEFVSGSLEQRRDGGGGGGGFEFGFGNVNVNGSRGGEGLEVV